MNTSDTFSGNWLQEFLVASVRNGLCTKINCTTCGAREFRRGVVAALEVQTANQHAFPMGPQTAGVVVQALTGVHPIHDRGYIEAVRNILYDIWLALGGPLADRQQFDGLLEGTWAGTILAGMRAHDRARTEARVRYMLANDPEKIRQRRDEKQRLRQQRQDQHLARSRESTRRWRQAHGLDPL